MHSEDPEDLDAVEGDVLNALVVGVHDGAEGDVDLNFDGHRGLAVAPLLLVGGSSSSDRRLGVLIRHDDVHPHRAGGGAAARLGPAVELLVDLDVDRVVGDIEGLDGRVVHPCRHVHLDGGVGARSGDLVTDEVAAGALRAAGEPVDGGRSARSSAWIAWTVPKRGRI